MAPHRPFRRSNRLLRTRNAVRHLQLLLFDAFSNLISHAQATPAELNASCETMPGGRTIRTVLSDKGRGFTNSANATNADTAWQTCAAVLPVSAQRCRSDPALRALWWTSGCRCRIDAPDVCLVSPVISSTAAWLRCALRFFRFAAGCSCFNLPSGRRSQ